jgi:hypothetical protein
VQIRKVDLPEPEKVEKKESINGEAGKIEVN